MTGELAEESVVLLRVKPGHVEKAVKELKQHSTVRVAEPILGPYDVAVTGAFPNIDAMRRFQTEIESKEFCEGCASLPGFELWRGESKGTHPVSAWTLIRATDVTKTAKELTKLPLVERVLSTSGEYNLIARVGATDSNQLQQRVLSEIQGLPGLRRTETFLALSER
jgi:DNA-binding Lrp family transcriptional regulator